MGASKMRDNMERWLIHHDYTIKSVKNPETSFHIRVRHTGMPIDIFEPKTQPGTIVIGTKVTMLNKQIKRYQGFTPDEKKKWEERVRDFCTSIHAIHRNMTEDGKQKVGVYIVLEKKIGQQLVMDTVNQIAGMHERTSIFLMKTF